MLVVFLGLRSTQHSCFETGNLLAMAQCEEAPTKHLRIRRIQTKDVVAMAAIVPMGIDFCASFRFPDRFDPAMIP